MDNLKFFKKKSVIFNLSFLAIICLASLNILLASLFSWIESSLNYEYNSVCVEELNQFSEKMDSNLMSINNLGNRFSLTGDIMNFRTVETLTKYNRYTMSKITEDLSRYVLTNELISDIFLYYKKGDFFVTSNGCYSKADKGFFSNYYFDISNYQLNNLMDKQYVQDYQIISDKSGDKQLYFLDTLPYGKNADVGINLVIKINMERLYGFLDYDSGRGTTIAYKDNLGNSIGNQFSIPSKYETANYKNRYKAPSFQYTVKGQPYVMYTRHSKVLNGEYCAVYKAGGGFPVIESIGIVKPLSFLFLNIIFVFIGFIVVYMFFPKLKNIRNLLYGKIPCSLNMESIESGINRLMERNEYLEKKSASRKRKLRQYYLLDYLKNPVADSRLLNEYRAGFEADSYAYNYLLCLVKIMDAGVSDNSDKLYWSMQKSKKIIDENLSDKLKYEQYIDDNGFIILFWEERDKPRKDIKSLSAVTLRKFANKYALQISIEFSDTFDNLDQIKSEYQKLPGYNERTDEPYQTIETGISKIYFTNLNKALHSKDFDSLPGLAGELSKKYLEHPNLDLEIMRMDLAQILLSSCSMIKKNGSSVNESSIKGALTGIFNAESPAEITDRFTNFYNGCIHTKEIKKDRGQFEVILDYVNANIFNPGIDLSMIEEKFGINGPAFSKLFKKQMNIGYLDYIHTKRVEKAVKLLVETDWTNLKIAQECGYISDIAMIRAFQKIMNTSPGNVRRQKRGGSKN